MCASASFRAKLVCATSRLTHSGAWYKHLIYSSRARPDAGIGSEENMLWDFPGVEDDVDVRSCLDE
jgi:hypothetical protein